MFWGSEDSTAEEEKKIWRRDAAIMCNLPNWWKNGFWIAFLFFVSIKKKESRVEINSLILDFWASGMKC